MVEIDKIKLEPLENLSDDELNQYMEELASLHADCMWEKIIRRGETQISTYFGGVNPND